MLSFCYQSRIGRGGNACCYWVSAMQAVIPTRFWQAHLKRFCWAHLAHIIHIRHIPPFGMGYPTLCCQSVATLGRAIIAKLVPKIKQIRLAYVHFSSHTTAPLWLVLISLSFDLIRLLFLKISRFSLWETIPVKHSATSMFRRA